MAEKIWGVTYNARYHEPRFEGDTAHWEEYEIDSRGRRLPLSPFQLLFDRILGRKEK